MLSLAFCLLAAAFQPAPADLVIENALIWSDGLVGFAEFAAVRDGRFLHVGRRNDALIGPRTKRVDAGGRVIIPGLIDAHIHMLGGGTQLSRLQLREAADRESFVRRVAEWAATLGPGEWILGGRWSVESWADPKPPTKEWVDAVSGDHPLYLARMDGHSALVNSVALRLAGITGSGPADPEGGVIDRDPRTGEPTGILRESAMSLVAPLIPRPTPADQMDALGLAMREAARHGITAVGDIPGIGDLPVYERLASSEVQVRFYVYPTTDDWTADAPRARRFRGRSGWVEVKGLKGYIDGSLGSRTAYMRRPYLGNEPGRESWRGLLREGVEGGRFAGNVTAARRAGLQAIAHAIGDEANHLLLETLAAAYPDLPAARCRSEHAQHLLPQDIPRFGRQGVIACMQPYHKADDGRYAERYIGAERSRSSYAFKSLLDAGAVVAFGSDWPVVTLNPFLGVEAAVTGRTLDGKAWQTQQNITVAEALRCYTSRAAFAVFADDQIGRIAPRYRADFVVLDRSPFDPDVDWSAIRPVAVYVEGKKVFGEGTEGLRD
ncbi:MAG: amidohydrolase [Planctomycetota bacterium]|jgi:predicted amidohydrolase YtcJ